MSVVSILRELHYLRRRAKELQDQIDRAPLQLKAQQARVAYQENAVKEAEDALKHKKKDLHEKEVTLKQTFEAITKHERQASGEKKPEVLAAFKKEIDAEKAECARLEEEILADMTNLDERTAQLPELKKTLQQVRDEVAQFERTQGERQATQKQQLTDLQKQIGEMEATLPPDVRTQYTRMVAAKKDDALSAVKNKICVACYTAITAQNYNDLLAGRLVMCKSCGRMLYLPEEQKATS